MRLTEPSTKSGRIRSARKEKAMHTKPKFVYDEAGNKTDVLMPYSDYEALLEALEDANDFRVITERRAENNPTVSLEEMKKRLGL
jgi:hypothetical protein